jgi:hypothetical protein
VPFWSKEPSGREMKSLCWIEARFKFIKRVIAEAIEVSLARSQITRSGFVAKLVSNRTVVGGMVSLVCSFAWKSRSVFLDHHFGSFHDSGDRIALLEFQLVGAAPGDNTLDEVVSDADDNVGHHVAHLNFFDFSTQLVSG